MANDEARADHWRAFIGAKAGYPAPERLHVQLAQARFFDFCSCGCNSFAVAVEGEAPPLVAPGGGYGAIYAADFRMPDERTLEIVLFANETGNLAYVEIDCCANSYPIPDMVEVVGPPFRVEAYGDLLA